MEDYISKLKYFQKHHKNRVKKIKIEKKRVS